MKLLFKNIDKKNSGYFVEQKTIAIKCSQLIFINHTRTVRLVAEEAEDMWHAYNLICVGDYLRSSTIRRVVNESAGKFFFVYLSGSDRHKS